MQQTFCYYKPQWNLDGIVTHPIYSRGKHTPWWPNEGTDSVKTVLWLLIFVNTDLQHSRFALIGKKTHPYPGYISRLFSFVRLLGDTLDIFCQGNLFLFTQIKKTLTDQRNSSIQVHHDESVKISVTYRLMDIPKAAASPQKSSHDGWWFTKAAFLEFPSPLKNRLPHKDFSPQQLFTVHITREGWYAMTPVTSSFCTTEGKQEMELRKVFLRLVSQRTGCKGAQPVVQLFPLNRNIASWRQMGYTKYMKLTITSVTREA